MNEQLIRLGMFLEQQLQIIKKHLGKDKLYLDIINNDSRQLVELRLEIPTHAWMRNDNSTILSTHGPAALEEMLVKLQDVDHILKTIFKIETAIRAHDANKERYLESCVDNLLYRTFKLED